MTASIAYRVRFGVDDRVLSDLHHRAFGSLDASVQPWQRRLERHSFTWVGGFDGPALVGFVNLCWDGGAHAFVLDTAVHPDHQRRGVGRNLVRLAAREAAGAGCRWLHVDDEPGLRSFYQDSCGFGPTDAGLMSLTRRSTSS